jgi:hypothetical protein
MRKPGRALAVRHSQKAEIQKKKLGRGVNFGTPYLKRLEDTYREHSGVSNNIPYFLILTSMFEVCRRAQGMIDGGSSEN